MAVDPFIYIAHTESYSNTNLEIQRLSMRSGEFMYTHISIRSVFINNFFSFLTGVRSSHFSLKYIYSSVLVQLHTFHHAISTMPSVVFHFAVLLKLITLLKDFTLFSKYVQTGSISVSGPPLLYSYACLPTDRPT